MSRLVKAGEVASRTAIQPLAMAQPPKALPSDGLASPEGRQASQPGAHGVLDLKNLYPASAAKASSPPMPEATVPPVPRRSPTPPTAQADAPAASAQGNCSCESHEAAITELQACLDQAEELADQREDDAYDRGLRAGRELAVADEAARLTQLSDALSAMQHNLAQKLSGTELLALQLARAGLEKIFGPESDRADQVAETLKHQLEHIRREMIAGVRVSAEDFPSAERLDALRGDLQALTLTADPALSNGECVIDLTLGKLDLGLRQQWLQLAALFDEMTEAEVKA